MIRWVTYLKDKYIFNIFLFKYSHPVTSIESLRFTQCEQMIFKRIQVILIINIRPAFVNTLFPVTCPHHIYSTALVIIIVIDNLKSVIIFVYVWFLPWKIPEVSENASQFPSKQNFR